MPDPTPVDANLDTAALIGKTFDVTRPWRGTPMTQRITVHTAFHAEIQPYVQMTVTVHREDGTDRADSLLLPYGESSLTEVDDA